MRALLLCALALATVACGPSLEDLEAEQRRIDHAVEMALMEQEFEKTNAANERLLVLLDEDNARRQANRDRIRTNLRDRCRANGLTQDCVEVRDMFSDEEWESLMNRLRGLD